MEVDALSYRVQALRLILEDLEQAPGAAELLRSAQGLLRYYLALTKRAGSLTGKPLALRLPGTPRRPYAKRQRPKKQGVTRQYVLAILREAIEPLSSRQIRERLAEEGRVRGRQGVAYQLTRLRRAGEVELVAIGPEGAKRWRALD